MAANPVTSGRVVQLDSRSYVGADGDSVTTWSDDTANGNHATGSGATRPIYKTGIINGNPVMRFATDGMRGVLSGGNWSEAAGVSYICMLTNFTSMTSFGGLGSVGVSGFDNNSSSLSLGGTTGVVDRFGLVTSSSVRITLSIPSRSGLSVYSGGFDATGWCFGADGGSIKSPAAVTVGTSQNDYSVGCRLFGGLNTASGPTADYCMVAIYDRLLSADEHRDVALWMLTEFGQISSGGTSGFTGLSGVGRLGT